MEQIETMTRKLQSEDFFPLWNKEIKLIDCRSAMGPITISGIVIGIRLDSVLLRRCGIITDWYPINHSQIEWKI